MLTAQPPSLLGGTLGKPMGTLKLFLSRRHRGGVGGRGSGGRLGKEACSFRKHPSWVSGLFFSVESLLQGYLPGQLQNFLSVLSSSI